jgi:hypothetical protein
MRWQAMTERPTGRDVVCWMLSVGKVTWMTPTYGVIELYIRVVDEGEEVRKLQSVSWCSVG